MGGSSKKAAYDQRVFDVTSSTVIFLAQSSGKRTSLWIFDLYYSKKLQKQQEVRNHELVGKSMGCAASVKIVCSENN